MRLAEFTAAACVPAPKKKPRSPADAALSRRRQPALRRTLGPSAEEPGAKRNQVACDDPRRKAGGFLSPNAVNTHHRQLYPESTAPSGYSRDSPGSASRSHLGVGFARPHAVPCSNLASCRYGVARSLLS